MRLTFCVSKKVYIFSVSNAYLALTVRCTMLLTMAMEEVWRNGKSSIGNVPPMSEDLRNVLAELKLSSAAEKLSNLKNHPFWACFLQSNHSRCQQSIDPNIFPKK